MVGIQAGSPGQVTPANIVGQITMAQVGAPGCVGGTQLGLFGHDCQAGCVGQAAPPAQLGAPWDVTQLAASQLTAPAIVGHRPPEQLAAPAEVGQLPSGGQLASPDMVGGHCAAAQLTPLHDVG
jgi:hypothetical protein